MRTIAIAAVTLSVAAMAAPAAPASAPHHRVTLCTTAYNARQAVIKKLGKRAPGRNICRQGVQSKYNHAWVREATTAERAHYLRNLRALLVPTSSLLIRTAVPPSRPPAGTMSPGVAAGGLASCIAQRESGGDPTTNTGNGYSGKFQFDDATWHAAGGTTAHAYQASEAEQDAAFARWYPGHPTAWPRTGPACGG